MIKTENGTPVWLITGCSMGLGRALSETVLARGHRVMLTALDIADLQDLLASYPATARAATLDVTKPAQIEAAVTKAQLEFGAVDVLVNNAGYGLVGAMEETSPDEYRPLFEANLFGPIELIRAVLPGMRARRTGHVVNVSSVGGFTASPGFGLYGATKFGLEGLSEALAQEVASFGIHVTIVEPGAMRTNFRGTSMRPVKHQLDVYAETTGAIRTFIGSTHGTQAGNPSKAAAAILAAVESESPPGRLPLGRDAFDRVRRKLKFVAGDLDAWEAIAGNIAFDHVAPAMADPRWAAKPAQQPSDAKTV